jgi:hypothetical protein
VQAPVEDHGEASNSAVFRLRPDESARVLGVASNSTDFQVKQVPNKKGEMEWKKVYRPLFEGDHIIIKDVDAS